MIQIIGLKRLIILLILVGVNVVLALANYSYTAPQSEQTTRKERILRSQVSTLQADIDRMHVEFEQLDKQKLVFDGLIQGGFFSNQIRSDARKVFSRIQDDSGVVSAIVNVRSGSIKESEEAKKAKHKVLVSPVEIELAAFDDASIYKYMHLVEQRIEGFIAPGDITINRVRDVSAPVLRAISAGAKPVLVKAKMKLLWHTMIPESQVIEAEKK